MTTGAWATVWGIAAQRHSTKMGEGHLSEHAHGVLQQFVMEESAEAVESAMGHIFWVRPHGLSR